MQETLMDDRGRVTLGKEIGKKYGLKFFVVEAPGEILLIPKAKDPIKELREWGKRAGIKGLTSEEIRKLAEDEAYEQLDKKIKKRKR